MGFIGGNSTSYQIRLDLIKVAKDLLEFDYGQKQQELDNIWAAQVADWEKGSSGTYDYAEHVHPLPKQAGAPTVEEVLAIAEKLNDFVSRSTGSNIGGGDSGGGNGGLTLSLSDEGHF
jgi:hypothetical protein